MVPLFLLLVLVLLLLLLLVIVVVLPLPRPRRPLSLRGGPLGAAGIGREGRQELLLVQLPVIQASQMLVRQLQELLVLRLLLHDVHVQNFV